MFTVLAILLYLLLVFFSAGTYFGIALAMCVYDYKREQHASSQK